MGQQSELYGRALVVIAADRYAQRMVLPAAKQGCPGAVVLARGPRDRGAGGDRHAAPARVARATRGGRRRSARHVRTHVCAGTRSGSLCRRRGGQRRRGRPSPASGRRRRSRRRTRSPRRPGGTPPRSSAGRGPQRGAPRRFGRSGSVREVMRTGPPAITGPGRRARRSQAHATMTVRAARAERSRPRPRTVESLEITLFLCPFSDTTLLAAAHGFSRPQQAVSYLSK